MAGSFKKHDSKKKFHSYRDQTNPKTAAIPINQLDLTVGGHAGGGKGSSVKKSTKSDTITSEAKNKKKKKPSLIARAFKRAFG